MSTEAVIDGEAPLADHRTTDWPRVRRIGYVLRQTVRYEYGSAVSDLRQRLIIVPPKRHGDQVRRGWSVTTATPSRRRVSHDAMGNLVVDFAVDRVESSVEFTSFVVVERSWASHRLRAASTRSFTDVTPLTTPGPELRDAAAALAGAEPRSGAESGRLDLAERICDWVSSRMTFRHGVTSVDTSAAEAFALRGGVCQDYAHVMITICRQAGLRARYVSGHLLGEGPSHAWVEVLTADPSTGHPLVTALDPTHNRRAGIDYLTIATGRDYRDVAPMSGTCRAAEPGVLSTTKQTGLADVEYRAA